MVSHIDHLRGIVTPSRYMNEDSRSITDHRVAESSGGGLCPEQHWGYLCDGRPFYLRMRHSSASLQVGPPGSRAADLPMVNPQWIRADFEAAFDADEPYPHSFFLEPRPYLQVYPDDQDAGYFDTDEDRQRTFSLLLDEVLQELGQEGIFGTVYTSESP